MTKAWWMVLSGSIIGLMSFSANALTQGEMEDNIAAKTGVSKAQAHNALQAFENQLKEEAAAKRAVKLDDFGTYKPRELQGQRTGRTLGGGTATYDNWRLVKKPQTVGEAEFNQRAAARAGMSVEDYAKVQNAMKDETRATLRKGSTVVMHGHGTYRVAKADTYGEGRNTKTVRQSASRTAKSSKFEADKNLKDRLN